jgi:UDP-N-acetylmuramate dehydrogenase
MTLPLSCVRESEILANHTSFRIGGPAEFFSQPSGMTELIELFDWARKNDIPVSILGGGTNCLVADRGVRGLVISLGHFFKSVSIYEDQDEKFERVRCGAAVWTQRLVALACKRGWAGTEVLAGLPGQIGGAIAMNAQNIGQFVEEITMVTLSGQIKKLQKDEVHFAYRYTALEPGIVTEAELRFEKEMPSFSSQRIHETIQHRSSTQELKLPSAGCAFKNPPGNSAGRLIDRLGLKGARIGDAQISNRHANFIVNVGQASCDDVISLMEHVQLCVSSSFGVWLEPEVRLLGEKWEHINSLNFRV